LHDIVIFETRPARGCWVIGCFRFIAGSNYCGFEMYFFTENDLAHIALLKRMWSFYYVTELTRLVAAANLREDPNGDGQLRWPTPQ
jgi:hypothetical protein